jgi:hypothetical protein
VVLLVGIDFGVLLMHHDTNGNLHLAVKTFIPYLAGVEAISLLHGYYSVLGIVNGITILELIANRL